jgi:predicted GNAT family acetyltransferase
MAMASAVRDNPAQNQFEMDTQAGITFARYRRDGATLTVLHTEVPRAIEGRGLGTRLVRGMLDMARERGDKVVPLCGFVRAFIARNPAYADLLK